MRAKIIKAFLTVIATLLISEAFLLGIHYLIANKYQKTTDTLTSEYLLTKSSADLVNSFYDLIQYSNDKQRNRAFSDRLSATQALLSKLDKSLAYGESWTVYVGVRNSVNTVIGDVNKGMTDLSAGNFSDVTNDYYKAANDNNFVRDNVSALVMKELETTAKAQSGMNSAKFWSEIVAIALFVVVMVGCIAYARFCANLVVSGKFSPLPSETPGEKK